MERKRLVNTMDRNIRNLWIKALKGKKEAYRKLGMMFLRGKGCPPDRKLAQLCLKKAMEMGDQKSFFVYHCLFSKGKLIIDRKSYEEICEDYRNEKNRKRKRELAGYLEIARRSQNARRRIKAQKEE